MGGRLVRALLAAISIALAVADPQTALRAQTSTAPCGLELRVLVLSADGGEAVLPAITQVLDYIGTPYRTYIASQTPGGLTPAFLADGCHANFNAVIQTTGDLATETSSGWSSALTAEETQGSTRSKRSSASVRSRGSCSPLRISASIGEPDRN